MDLETQLDAQIAHVRTEIAKLRGQKQRLSSALLGCGRIQKQLSVRKTTGVSNREDVNSLDERLALAIDKEKTKNNIKVHRLGFGVTAFPFTDSAPARTLHDQPNAKMLGVRIDLHPTAVEIQRSLRQDRTGRQVAQAQELGAETERQEEEHDTTYLVLFRRLQHNNTTYLKIHQHNIPKHIDTDFYQEKYLPLPSALQDHNDETMDFEVNPQPVSTNTAGEEDSFQDDSGIDLTMTEDPENNAADTNIHTNLNPSVQNNNQSLHTFIISIHNDLRSWHYRVQYIAFLCSSLDLSRPNATQKTVSIYNLQQTTNDARNLQIIWANGTLGLLKLDYEGYIDRAVVYGPSSQTGEDESEIDSENDSSASDTDDSNPQETRNTTQSRPRSRQKTQRIETNSHVRLHTIERLLTRTEHGTRTRIQDLLDRLQLVEKEFEVLD